MNAWEGNRALWLVGKFGHANLCSKGSGPDSAWLKRGRTRGRESRPLLPTQGASTFSPPLSSWVFDSQGS